MPKQSISNLPEWEDPFTSHIYTSIEDFPEHAYGFVYLIKFEDGTKYIGKKVLHREVWIPRTKATKPHPKSVQVKARNTGKGYRRIYDLIVRESTWKTYKGSSAATATRTPVRRYVLDIAYSNRELTYLEAKHLFIYAVLEKEEFLNSNILGEFFKGNLR